MKKLYNHSIFDLDIGQNFTIPKEGWHLEAEKSEKATKMQQEILKLLGWGKDKKLSKNGARVIIDSILYDEGTS